MLDDGATVKYQLKLFRDGGGGGGSGGGGDLGGVTTPASTIVYSSFVRQVGANVTVNESVDDRDPPPRA
jgi:hypothetical protein